MQLQKTPTSLVFGVNGERFELTHVHPSTTLLEFLRTHTRFKSAKLGCGEGEAVFVDDIPSPPNCLHGAYIYSAKPLARVRSIKLNPELQLDRVRDVISSKDIPNGGENIGSKTVFGIEPLFAEEEARCVGERLAFVVATSCALAAHKLQRPVRIYLNRKTDMIMAGGRHPMKITYSVGFRNDGKITALKLQILVNAGIYVDISAIMPHNVVSALKKYDWGTLACDIKVCRTNHPSRSAMRGPGEVQGSFIAEAIIENVAATLSKDVDSVRSINLHTYNSLQSFYEYSHGEPNEYTLPIIWNELAVSANYDQRTKMVQEFNRINTWKKRGISRVPVVIQLMQRPTPGKVSIFSDGSVVVEVGGIEVGQGLWTKVKQMAAYALGAIQCDGIGGLLDKIRVIQSDTVSLIQGGFTAGSTTSESSCEAVRLSCNILVERLKPLKENLQKEMGSINWETLILQAYMQAVNLSASSFYVPSMSSMSYLNYGAAISEVEIDLLNGETRFLQTDIIYDCGQSLNPAVDLGQIEGAFVQGLGYFMLEQYETNLDGLVLQDGTWNYKIPTIDTIPLQFNVQILNSGHHQHRVLSSKASGEPPLLLAASIHCATRAAVKEARKQLLSWSNQEEDSIFQLEVPATMPVVKALCGLDNVERYLKWKMGRT
ncbi:hypothetical protein LR48_Vigan07g043900 [Vigna angularis]|uniref:Aldehyde oxidase/xanthine dehydrogenase a/b hammerhead domain-containing protein n=1 Tax=Phaseolus angularis TaxID=3914 RepID=A0A0L9UV41_PHAAN|nr:hypothetical protein LR48_Vigan07g043900 [Vigna angularis]